MRLVIEAKFGNEANVGISFSNVGELLDGKAGRLVAGFRGAAPADTDALVDLLLRLSRLVDELPEIAELDLNPILASPNGCVAVDARVRIAAARSEQRLKSW